MKTIRIEMNDEAFFAILISVALLSVVAICGICNHYDTKATETALRLGYEKRTGPWGRRVKR
jgi:hypothetical protein